MATPTKKLRPGSMRMWAGFSDGKLHVRDIDTGFGGWQAGMTNAPAIFARRIDARREYEDVRPVVITIQPGRRT